MKTTDRFDRLRIASPCPASWAQMTGDDRVRFFDLCNLHVYNFTELTRTEAESLIANSEGRICARLYRRADGTVITKDCPVGLRAIRRRIAKVAGVVCTAILTVGGNVFARGDLNLTASERPTFVGNDSLELPMQAISASVSGTITDPNDEPIRGAVLTLINLQTNHKQVAKSDKKGRYRFFVSQFGSYTLKVEAAYFHNFQQDLAIHLSDELRLDVSLIIGGMVGVVVSTEAPRTGFDLNGVHVRINEE